MDELACYFSATDDNFNEAKAEDDHFTQSKQSNHRCNFRKFSRPVSMNFSANESSKIFSKNLSELDEFDETNPSDDGEIFAGHSVRGVRVRNSASMSNFISTLPNQLPPEVEAGNIEYKRKLVDPTPNRFEHLVTQMKWRLNEGGGKAIYRLGVEDNGHVAGLPPLELASSLATLERMASRLNATVQVLREKKIEASPDSNSCQNNQPGATEHQPHRALELLVKQTPLSNHGKPSVCIAVLGAVDVGKSTLIGVLTDGELDNARGRARLNLFRHLHEVQSGRTSCLSSELLGFDATGNVTNYKRTDGRLNRSSISELIRRSSQLVTLLDSAGHSKYQRTTLAGLSRAFPVGVILVVSATVGLTAIGLDHAQLAHTLGLPIAVVISKIDQLVSDMDRGRQVAAVCRQISLRFSQLKQSLPGGPSKDTLTDPLFFPVSAVTGEGLEKLLHFLHNVGCNAHAGLLGPSHLNLLPRISATKSSVEEDEMGLGETLFTRSVCELISSGAARYRSAFMCFWVSEVFTCVLGVPDPVLFGMVKSGQLMVGHVAWLGPDQTGEFHLVQIMSLHHNRQPHSVVFAGQTASVAVRFLINLCKSKSRESMTATAPVEKRRSSGPDSGFPTVENDENVPESVSEENFIFSHDALSPMTLRRGMVLLSNVSWSNSYADMVQFYGANVPMKIPHMISSDQQSAGVAWIVEVEVVQRLSIFPGVTASPIVLPPLPITKQKVTFYAGCVAQPVTVLVESDAAATCEIPKLQLRFTRNPEYIEVGRQCILTWASCAKAVGRVSKILDLYPHSSQLSNISCWISTRARLTNPLMDLPSISSDDADELSGVWTSSLLEDGHIPSAFSPANDCLVMSLDVAHTEAVVNETLPQPSEDTTQFPRRISTQSGQSNLSGKASISKPLTRQHPIDAPSPCDKGPPDNAKRKPDTVTAKRPTPWRRRRRKDR